MQLKYSSPTCITKALLQQSCKKYKLDSNQSELIDVVPIRAMCIMKPDQHVSVWHGKSVNVVLPCMIWPPPVSLTSLIMVTHSGSMPTCCHLPQGPCTKPGETEDSLPFLSSRPYWLMISIGIHYCNNTCHVYISKNISTKIIHISYLGVKLKTFCNLGNLEMLIELCTALHLIPV